MEYKYTKYQRKQIKIEFLINPNFAKIYIFMKYKMNLRFYLYFYLNFKKIIKN